MNMTSEVFKEVRDILIIIKKSNNPIQMLNETIKSIDEQIEKEKK